MVRSPLLFPNPDDLTIGTTRSQLTIQYGAPALQTSALRNGRFLERYYYSNADHTLLTIATLENGALVDSTGARF